LLSGAILLLLVEAFFPSSAPEAERNEQAGSGAAAYLFAYFKNNGEDGLHHGTVFLVSAGVLAQLQRPQGQS
jgi:hypothetical protein